MSSASETEGLKQFEALKPQTLVTSDQLFRRVGKSSAILLVYRDSCGYCRQFKPDFVTLCKKIADWNAKQNKGNPSTSIVALTMESDNQQNARFLNDQDVTGVPTIFFISPTSGRLHMHKGSRSPDDLFQELLKHNGWNRR
jgi:hypothetical protein